MIRGASASRGSVLRSRRPQDTPRNFMHENRETSGMPTGNEHSRPAGEGDSHEARMYVPEESDSGIVLMNHLNKDGKPLAENEEGRPLIKENTHQLRTRPTQSGARVSQRLASVRQAEDRLAPLSEIRAVCANECTYGSVRGAISNGRPYRERLRTVARSPNDGAFFMIERLGSRATRFAIDAQVAIVGLYLAYLVRYDGMIPKEYQRQLLLLLTPVGIGYVVVQLLFGIHKHKWRYVSFGDTVRICEAYATFSAVLFCLRVASPSLWPYGLFRIPMGVIAMQFMFSLSGAIAVRGLRRFVDQRTLKNPDVDGCRRVLLVGAGIHGVALANVMAHNARICVVGFLDDDRQKIGSVIASFPVLGPISTLAQVIDEYKVDEVLICLSAAAQKKLKLEMSSNDSVWTRIFPTVGEILSAEAELMTFSQIPAVLKCAAWL